jgi:hypothetical protein
MNWYSPRFLVLPIASCLLLALGALCIASCGGTNQPRTTKTPVPPLPTPGSARTIYTSAQFGYTIHYPTQWYLKPQNNNSLIRVFMKYDPSVPQAVAFEIRCYANPNQLDAKTYWQQSQPANGGEIGKGVITFSSGATAYTATGQGQTPYTLYTLVHGQVACTILIPETDPSNAQVVLTTINSFRWQ